MSAVYRLEHVGIGVPADKFEQTMQFYQQVFGWHLIKESQGSLAFIGDGEGGRLELVITATDPLPSPHHLAFVVDLAEFDRVMAALRDAGAQLREPTTNVFGDRLLFFADPAGNAAQIVGRQSPLAP